MSNYLMRAVGSYVAPAIFGILVGVCAIALAVYFGSQQ